ncbi:MAG TPA: SAM-dependent methyltransferase [Rhizomicrobium sp.]|jgi:SAM-dependent MidA family methyltransferase|nr:SAM-dependent methyltransferase [Rhizomicrobium sp.]
MSLGARIADLIEAQGPMSVAQFMTMALLDPKEGYYATRDPFGAGGDFTTAPEISQMFGEMAGLWLLQAWADQGSPKNPRLVELGPGRGTLMADILRVAQVAPEFTADLEVVLVEASPALQKIQAEKLRGLGADVSWQAQFDDSLADRPLFLVANEFFDALPLRQYVKTERGWCERMVTVLNGDLAFALAPVPVPPSAIPADRANAPDGGVYEASPAATALAEDIARTIAARGGAALMIDYGYGEAGGFSETLQAVSGHRFADALAEPGEDDISAHVDFAALAQAGRRGGASVFGPATQGAFLANIGIVERAEQLMKSNPDEAQKLLVATERLIGNDQMGRLFKVLAFAPPALGGMAGFGP